MQPFIGADYGSAIMRPSTYNRNRPKKYDSPYGQRDHREVHRSFFTLTAHASFPAVNQDDTTPPMPVLEQTPVPTPKPLKPAYPFKEQYPAAKGWVIQHHPDIKVRDLYCCGVKELHGIQDRYQLYNTEKAAYSYEPWTIDLLLPAIQVAYEKACQNRDRPFLIFTDNRKEHPTGPTLADYIEKNDLGTVHRSERRYNANSGNSIVVYLWTVNSEALKAWKPDA